MTKNLVDLAPDDEPERLARFDEYTIAWTTPRQQLRDALARYSPIASELYSRAIEALARPPLTRAALMVGGHCLRELISALPELLADVDELPSRADTSGPLSRLVETWERDDIPSLLPIQGHPQDGDSPRSVTTVPTTFIQAVEVLVRQHQAGTGSGRLRHSALVLGRLEHGPDATLELFRKSYDFIMNNVHFDRAIQRPLPSMEEVELHLGRIERAIESRVGAFYSVVEDLEDLLELANETEGERDDT